MVKQYPYELFVIKSDSDKSSTGSYQSTSTWELASACRDEKTNSREIKLNDSTIYISNLVVFLPKNCPVVKQGTKIEVRENGLVRAKGTVREFDSGQLNCRIWL